MIKTGTAGGCAKLKKDKAKLEQQGCSVNTHPLCSVDCGGERKKSFFSKKNCFVGNRVARGNKIICP